MEPLDAADSAATQQGTVKAFDAGTRTGSVFTDDGIEHSFDANALSPRIRHLRLGQRVRIALDGDRLSRMQIITLPDE